MFDLVKIARADAIPVDMLVGGMTCESERVGRDHGLGTDLRNAGAKAVAIIALVGEQLVDDTL